MNTTELAELVAAVHGLSNVQAERLVEAMFATAALRQAGFRFRTALRH